MKIMKFVLCLMMCGTLFSIPVYGDEMSNYELTEEIKTLKEGPLEALGGRISLSGLVEVEAGYEKIDFNDPGEEDQDSSDFSLATVELGFDAEITEHVSGHVLLLYEDGEDILIDEGFLLLEGNNSTPFYLKAGEIYVPFGNFESHMVSDPLTLEIGETRETAVEIGFEHHGFYGSFYAFNGDIDKDGDDNNIDNFGLNAGYALENDDFSMDLGLGWINNIADSDGISDILTEESEAAEALGVSFALRDYVPGLGAHVLLSFGSVSFIGEYVALLKEPEWNVTDMVTGSMAALGLDPVEKGAKAAAWNVEMGYGFSLLGKDSTFALGLQGAEDLEDFLPEKRLMGSIAMEIFDRTTLAFEYLHDDFESNDKGDTLTAQIAIEF